VRPAIHSQIPTVWLLPNTPVLPRVAPILPTARPAAFNDPAWLFEPKYGFRRMVHDSMGTILKVPAFEEYGRKLFEAACRLYSKEILIERRTRIATLGP